jgi:hypothetical protein
MQCFALARPPVLVKRSLLQMSVNAVHYLRIL